MTLTRGKKRPKLIGAALGDKLAELNCPLALIAEIVAPGPEPLGEAMQNMLLGETNGAVHLMGDRRAFAGGLAGPDLGGRHLKKAASPSPPIVAMVSAAELAAATAAAVSPARRARLCCTAWNLAIGFSKATRSWA